MPHIKYISFYQWIHHDIQKNASRNSSHGAGVIIAKQEIEHPPKTSKIKEHAVINGLSAGIPGGVYGLIGGATGGSVEFLQMKSRHVRLCDFFTS